VVAEFLARGLVPEASVERFREALRSAYRLRNSVAAEVAMLLFIYGVGIPVLWRHFAALDAATWYSTPTPGGLQLTPAGYWYAYVSVPVFQFLLLRWYFRIAIWIRFLWQVSRIRLALSAAHGDLNAGLGFLAASVYAFVPLLMAHGALLGGNIANRVLYVGGKLPDSYIEVLLMLAYLLVLVVAPLAVFAPQVAEAKRRGLREFGRLAQRYARDFEGKWVEGAESPLGTGDIQSLADLSASLANIRATRPLPVSRDAIVTLAVATLAPMAPLLLAVIPAQELALRLIKLLL